MSKPSLPDLSHLAVNGTRIAVRVTPRASADMVIAGDPVQVRVTAPATDGRATDSVRRLLARAIGLGPSHLTLVQGATSRQKLFKVDL